MSYIHAGDKGVPELVRMVDGGVEQQVAHHVVDYLVDLDGPGVSPAGSMDMGFT